MRTTGLTILASAILMSCGSAPPIPESAASTESAASSAQVEVATTVAFTEGPTVDQEGNVYFTDVRNSRIMKLPVNGGVEVFRHPSNHANGLIFDGQWRLLACEGSSVELGKRK